jgi:hypothetical protein
LPCPQPWRSERAKILQGIDIDIFRLGVYVFWVYVFWVYVFWVDVFRKFAHAYVPEKAGGLGVLTVARLGTLLKPEFTLADLGSNA